MPEIDRAVKVLDDGRFFEITHRVPGTWLLQGFPSEESATADEAPIMATADAVPDGCDYLTDDQAAAVFDEWVPRFLESWDDVPRSAAALIMRAMDTARLVRTCDACPTQYDLFLPDGRYVYFRYRHSRWRLELYPTPDAFWGGEPVASVSGQPEPLEDDDGFMTHAEVMGLLEVALPELMQQADDVAPSGVHYEGFHLGHLRRVVFVDEDF